MSEAIRTLPSHSKLVLISIIKNYESGLKSMTTGDVYKLYCTISGIVGVTPLTQRRVGDLINELDSFGIVTASVCSFGRAGRTKVIELSIDKSIINEFKNNPTFKVIESFKPPKQTHLI